MKKEDKKISLEGLQVISFKTAIKGGTSPIKEDKGDKEATDSYPNTDCCGGDDGDGGGNQSCGGWAAVSCGPTDTITG